MRELLSRSLSLLLALPAVGQTMPDRILVGYWHNWTWPSAIRLSAVPTAYDVINIAFATPTTAFGSTMQFTPDPGIYPNPQDFVNDVAALQASGKKVMISIGGATAPVVVDTPTAAQSFAVSMAQIIATYGFDGLDIDLEGSSLMLQAGDTDHRAPTSPRIVHFISGMNQLLGQLPPDFLLSAAPETAFVQGGMSAYAGVWGAYLPVLHAFRPRFSWVHVQHYNTGSMPGRNGQTYSPATADFHVAMADALIGGFTTASSISFAPFRPDQVMIGLPASSSAAGSGYTAPSIVHSALDRLILGEPGGGYALADPAGYPRFRGLMTWSIHWDVHAGHAFSQPHREYLDRVFLAVNRSVLSQSGASPAQLHLTAGRANAGRFHILLAGFTGSEPGTWLPGGVRLPLNIDGLSSLVLQPGWTQVFSGFLGPLDAAGQATAYLVPPPTPNLAGLQLHFAYTLGPNLDFASTGVSLTLTP